METKSFLDLSKVESGFPRWQKADIEWQKRAAKGAGVSGGPKRTHTAYFYGGGFFPFGRTWGGQFPPTKTCSPAPPPPSICVSLDPLSPCPSIEPPTPPPAAGGKPSPKPKP
jgi:hypothetical protein